jgi:hypothetical protein
MIQRRWFTSPSLANSVIILEQIEQRSPAFGSVALAQVLQGAIDLLEGPTPIKGGFRG